MTLVISLLILSVLLFPGHCKTFLLSGIDVWIHSMIPALFPFMVLSDLMLVQNMTDGFVRLFHPLLHRVFRVSKNGSFALFMGFFCGFPMGARTVCSLYSEGKLSRDEAAFLLSFCNNLGPAYFTGYALPLLGLSPHILLFVGMYGIPAFYGFLRYHLVCRRKVGASFPDTVNDFKTAPPGFFLSLNRSIVKSGRNLFILGGYILFFQLILSGTSLILPSLFSYAAPFIEITSGLDLLQQTDRMLSLSALSFGGLCTIAQTAECMADTDLSLSEYILHKLVITGMSAGYYLFLRFFLRLL